MSQIIPTGKRKGQNPSVEAAHLVSQNADELDIGRFGYTPVSTRASPLEIQLAEAS